VGLDVYVGSLTRYYAGDWELATARVARELGTKFEVARTDNPPDAIRDPEQIRPIVIEWRKKLSESLAGSLANPLDWVEESDAPYFTDKPAWDGYQALLLWAAYEEHPELRIPAHLPANMSEDMAIVLSTSEHYKTHYPTLLSDTRIWLPIDFSFFFRAPDCAGREVMIGSSFSLSRELDNLNKRTWNASEAELSNFAFEGSEKGVPLEIAARFALALFQRHAALSASHRLPMLLDW
jgi:hypothetical protein